MISKCVYSWLISKYNSTCNCILVYKQKINVEKMQKEENDTKNLVVVFFKALWHKNLAYQTVSVLLSFVTSVSTGRKW